ncbi:MAG: DUF1214 domain-containing protein [Acidimicrobiales bacterium]
MDTGEERTLATSAVFRELLRCLGDTADQFERGGHDELTTLEGYLWLIEYSSAMLEQYVHADARHPIVMPMVTPFRRFQGDLSLARHNYVAELDPAYTYRLRCVPGTAAFHSVTVHGGEHGGGQADRVVGKLSSDELILARGGTFDIILSRDERDGNWIPLGDEPGSLITREFFDDAPAVRREARWHIENLSAPVPARLDDARMAGGLQSALNNVKLAAERYPRPIGQPVFGRGNVNEFAAFHQFTPGAVTGWGNLDAIHTTMPYALEPDEAIVIDGGAAVDCAWWGITQNNRYLASFGAGEPVHLAGRSVHVDGDGNWAAVLSPVDPGRPNWLSTAGHRHGVVRIRWLLAKAMPPLPRTSVVSVRDHGDRVNGG